MTPELKLTSIPFDEDKCLRSMQRVKSQLFTVALEYVLESKKGTVNDRIRYVSDQTGIPRSYLEVMTKKRA